MENKSLSSFMKKNMYTGLTFDDVTLITNYADFLPTETDTATMLTKNIKMSIPFISAAMDTVTESEMAISMARLGGIGVIHKSLSCEKQAEEAHRVKHYLNGLIKAPVIFHPNTTVAEMLAEKEKKHYAFSGFPIVDDSNGLLGIVTGRDIKFLTDYSLQLKDVMTKKLVTAHDKTTLHEAFKMMKEYKVGKLPLIDKKGKLIALYSFQDVRSLIENINPLYNRDTEHRLRVAAAIGPYDFERAQKLVEVGTDVLVIDTAHGHSKGVIETVKMCKKKFSNTDIIAGNVGTGEGAIALARAGADAIKVGIGPGSICTTRVVAGVGVPQITAIYNAYKAIGKTIPIIADGGIKQSGDIAKAIAAGASCVMMGSVLAGTQESPGEKIYHKGRMYVVYRGMGSIEAMKENLSSRERYGVGDVEDTGKLVPQGIEGLVLYRGSVSEVVHQFIGGLRYSLGYCGAHNVRELQKKASFIRVTDAGLREAHPHDIKIIKDAPNYFEE